MKKYTQKRLTNLHPVKSEVDFIKDEGDFQDGNCNEINEYDSEGRCLLMKQELIRGCFEGIDNSKGQRHC